MRICPPRIIASWNRLSRGLIAIVAVVGACLPLTAQDAPQYDVLPLGKNSKGNVIANWNDMRTFARDDYQAIEAMLAGGIADQAAFDKFFNELIFPMFTHEPNFKHPSVSVAKVRQRGIRGDFLTAARNAAAKEQLLVLILNKMQQIAAGNFHPWARANAVLLIAELNESEPNGPPLKRALQILLKWSTDPQMVDAVRVPAFHGLERHAVAGIDANQRPQVVKAMLDIVKQHTAADHQSLEGHEWIMRRAIDVLGAIGEPGEQGAVYNELVKVVEDEAAPRSARATAAEMLVKIRFVPPKDYDAEGLATSLGKFAVEAYKAELAEAASKRQEIAVVRLKQQLEAVRTAIAGGKDKKGVAAMLATDAQKKYAGDLVAQIDVLNKACDEPRGFFNPLESQNDPNYVPGVPFDTQAPIAKAISTAGGRLQAILQAGAGGNELPATPPGNIAPPPGSGVAPPAPVKASPAPPGLPG
ncbi:MAG: hypothetical protein IT427_04250 [Pirellulales bacterium]|nr:hypothetical protein [Pirellulales bacterium]